MITRRLSGAVVSLIVLTLVGALGYGLIEQLSVVDAIYMSVITISTVGFGEVHALSSAGRIFAVVLILSGAGVAAYGLTSLSEFLVSGELQTIFQQRKRQRMVSKLSHHTIVCGYGRVGRHVSDELLAQGLPFVVLDTDPVQIERVRQKGYLALQGNAANEDHLLAAGIERAHALVATASSDAENVFIVLTARAMRPNLVIVARANYDESEEKLLRAGANRVLLPYRISGRRMVTLLTRPGVADFLDEVMHASTLELVIDQICLCAGSSLIGRTLGESNLRGRYGVTILAARLPGEAYNTSPSADTMLSAGEDLIVMGTREQIQALAQVAQSQS